MTEIVTEAPALEQKRSDVAEPEAPSFFINAAAIGGFALVALVGVVGGVLLRRATSAPQPTEVPGAESIGGSDTSYYVPVTLSPPDVSSKSPVTTSTEAANDFSTVAGTVTAIVVPIEENATTTGTTPTPAIIITTAAPQPRKLLLCTTRYPGPGNDPPDGLCDILVYDCRSGDISAKLTTEMQAFIAYAKKAIHSECGLNIERKDRDKVFDELTANSTRTALSSLWKANIRHYGTLRTELKLDPSSEEISRIATLLETLSDLQLEVSHGSAIERGYIFWGVSPLLLGRASPSSDMKASFEEVLRSARVDIVVYQTTFLRNGSDSEYDCVSTGPAMWKNAPSPNQATFEDSLNFRKDVELPPGTSEMLSLTLCAHWVRFPRGKAQTAFGKKSGCLSTTVDYAEEYFCNGGAKYANYSRNLAMVPESLQYVAVDGKRTWVGALDKSDTITKKVCMAYLTYGYQGGWAMHSLQCNFKKFCQDSNFTGGFPRVQVVSHYMNYNFTHC